MKRKIKRTYRCSNCGKFKETVRVGITICRECEKWKSPGKGQEKLI